MCMFTASTSNVSQTSTEDLTSFPDLSFAEVEGYAKNTSGCENTAKAYKFFAEPGYLHNIKGMNFSQPLF